MRNSTQYNLSKRWQNSQVLKCVERDGTKQASKLPYKCQVTEPQMLLV